ncbi:MAG: hypothetical protein HOM65_18735 [Verrucomicrobia bacterium]|nr:hypothetical protein [Verrucomicrobiota bacterium]MBT5480042.1 hypothetical protein [Verrucomicrobiota bacterium]
MNEGPFPSKTFKRLFNMASDPIPLTQTDYENQKVDVGGNPLRLNDVSSTSY